MTDVLEDKVVAALDRREARINELLAIARAADCRLAVTDATPAPLRVFVNPFRPMPSIDDLPVELEWEFVMLSPGERPPQGRAWTIYERRGDGWQGRSA